MPAIARPYPGSRAPPPEARRHWVQPDPPLSLTYPAKAENVAARDATDRPPIPTAIHLMPLTFPFLSRWLTERLYETLRACKQMTNTNVQISTGVEFSPAPVTLSFKPLLPVPVARESYGQYSPPGLTAWLERQVDQSDMHAIGPARAPPDHDCLDPDLPSQLRRSHSALSRPSLEARAPRRLGWKYSNLAGRACLSN